MNNVTDLMTVFNPISVPSNYINVVTIGLETPKKKNLFHKLGKFVGKTFSFFSRNETKAACMISYWAVETVLFAAIMLSAATPFIFFSALFLYLYGTYALYSATMVLL